MSVYESAENVLQKKISVPALEPLTTPRRQQSLVQVPGHWASAEAPHKAPAQYGICTCFGLLLGADPGAADVGRRGAEVILQEFD